MRPIPAPRIGDSHGLLRAISERERMRLDEFVTDFKAEDLFPEGLENAFGRTRQFVSYARSAGLLKEDRGTVELTEIGKRYIRAGDAERPFEVSEEQAEWLLRQLREKHMTDSIYHGLAIGLSLIASIAPSTRISTLDFGRALGYLGQAGWDNENTLQQQGERYITLLRDLSLIDEERAVTPTGRTVKSELTLPIHMSLSDIAAKLNPGGADAVRAAGEAEWAQAEGAAPEAAEAPAAAEAPEAPAAAPAPAPAEPEDEYEDVGPGQYRDVGASAPPPPTPEAPPPPAAAPAPAAAAPAGPPPTPPADLWDTAAPDESTRAYSAVEAPEPPAPEPAAPERAAPEPEPVAEGMTSGDPLAAPPPVRPGDAETVISTASAAVSPPEPAPEPPLAPAPPPPAPAPAPEPLRASGFLDANAIRAAAEGEGLRLPASVYANVAAALAAGKHVVLTGPPGAGKTTLALAVAKAAATSGRATGAVLVTAAERWSPRDTVGRPARDGEGMQPGHVVDAAGRGKWLVVDELDRAQPDRALGPLSTFLAGLPVTLPGGDEAKPAKDWRLVATAGAELTGGSAALLRRFAHVAVPEPAEGDLGAVIDAAAGGDQAAAGAARRLLVLRELRPLGAGVFRDAARHAAERNAIEAADEATLARDAYVAYVEPLLAGLDETQQLRLRELVERL